ncbi:threonine synthase [Brackiella oedipodis]|uniref:threonine synthase n=1 Tax=Brackiella oedipodis TaxID=124225 RepID=UPI00048D091D|nr:threonine synthase [Brackiella oedipodis]
MKYLSTRGGVDAVEFSTVLLEGLAPDGGLYVPAHIPTVTKPTLQAWRSLSYAELATEILSLYFTDIPKHDLAQLCQKTYTAEIFGSAQIVPLKPIDEHISLVGLSEGPTLAFKDMAMQLLGNLFEYVLLKQHRELNILGATSGDTGSAAEYALKGKKGLRVFMLSPQGRMSAFQRAQMYSLDEDNIFNIAVKGVFDECQDIVKALAGDIDFKKKYHLGAVNSINFARIAAQIVYYFWAWLRATQHEDQQVSFTVPSGNFGNILAGHYARQMGLPIHHLVLATNENNVLEEFFNTGVYRPRASEQTYATSSPSMDISKASNFERFVFDLFEQDPNSVKQLWTQLQTQGYFDLSSKQAAFEQAFGFVAGTSSHTERLAVIKETYEQHGVLIDPHTADGVNVARHFSQPNIPMLVLETALPAKFSETIQEAIGQPAPRPAALENIEQLPQHVMELECDVDIVKDFIQQHIGEN